MIQICANTWKMVIGSTLRRAPPWAGRHQFCLRQLGQSHGQPVALPRCLARRHSLAARALPPGCSQGASPHAPCQWFCMHQRLHGQPYLIDESSQHHNSSRVDILNCLPAWTSELIITYSTHFMASVCGLCHAHGRSCLAVLTPKHVKQSVSLSLVLQDYYSRSILQQKGGGPSHTLANMTQIHNPSSSHSWRCCSKVHHGHGRRLLT